MCFFSFMPQSHPLADLADLADGDGRSQPRPSFAAVEAIDFDLYESIVQLKVYTISS
jgi:hypothetical protein